MCGHSCSHTHIHSKMLLDPTSSLPVWHHFSHFSLFLLGTVISSVVTNRGTASHTNKFPSLSHLFYLVFREQNNPTKPSECQRRGW